jgi:hypothetical protein
VHQLTVAGNKERAGERLRNVGDARIVLTDVGLKRHCEAGELPVNVCGIDCIIRACCRFRGIGAAGSAAAQHNSEASADQADDKRLAHATLPMQVN